VAREVLERLGIEPTRRWQFETADGPIIERDVGEARARLNGEEAFTFAVFGDPGSEALLGSYTLEGFLLAPDPVHRRLIRVRGKAK
jgi:predicted aspartyl protease